MHQSLAHPPSTQTSILNASGIGKRYGNFWALKDISLTLSKGESLGIIGMNGAGKSTLLKIIAGSVLPTEGTIEVAGRVVPLLDLSAGFNDDYTGIENLRLSASILGMPKGTIDDHLAEIEDFAEIGDFVRKPLRTYSSGMRVRLAFALLTQVKPDVMIIDEALSVGDAYFAHKCARLIRQFRDEGRSLLFVSHDPTAIKTFCDHAVLLDCGRLVRAGSPSDTIDYYNAIIAAKEREYEIRVSSGTAGHRVTQSGDQQAILERFDILGDQGKTVRAIFCGSTIRIACGIAFNRTTISPTVGFMIRDRLGIEVFGTNTHYLGVKTRTYQPGEHMEVVFSVALNIGPGSYSCTIAVHAGADHREGNYDWRDNLIPLSVLPRWDFQFAGLAALPAMASVEDKATLLSRDLPLGQAIDFSHRGNAQRYLLTGWSAPEDEFCWTEGKKATMAVCIDAESDLMMQAKVRPFLPSGMSSQEVRLVCGETLLGEWKITRPTVLKARIPKAELEKSDELRLWWSLPQAQSPASAGLSEDHREIAVAFENIVFSRAI